MRDVVDQVVQTVTGVEVNGHRFVVELPEEPLAATADPEKLRQVCSILVENALRYSPDGGTVTVGAARRQDAVEVSVADEDVDPAVRSGADLPQVLRGADAESQSRPRRNRARALHRPRARDRDGREDLGLVAGRGRLAVRI